MLLYSCAQIVPLSGGEKDVTPPEELASFPVNKSVNFNATTIAIEFNEFIQLKNLNTQLIISPIINPKPEVLVKGKKLIIKLPDSLLANTTYSLNFGNAICDITENNSSPNYKYVFSTGSFIDSLSYSGQVVDASTLKPQEKVYVLLYNQHHDSVPLKELPNYIALTDKEGKYEVTNIAEGTYKLFALKDVNSNYLYDLPNENIGFYEGLIQLNTSQTKNQINLFEETHQKQYIKKITNKQYGKVEIVFNVPTQKLDITPLNIEQKTPWKLEEMNEQKDSLTLWLTLKEKQTSLSLVFKDWLNFIDTTEVKLMKALKDSSLILNTNLSSNFDLNQAITLSANRPLVKLDTQQIQLVEDSISVNFKLFNTSTTTKNFNLFYPFKEKTDYTLLIPANTMTDIYGLHNDTIIHSFKTKSTEDYGVIYLSLSPNFEEEYILQLYKDKKLISQKTKVGALKLTYDYLLPGAYKLKLIVDANKNGKWDTGNYLNKKQPERVILYQKEITIRANWDNEINWRVNE